jgi:hypothetical protein
MEPMIIYGRRQAIHLYLYRRRWFSPIDGVCAGRIPRRRRRPPQVNPGTRIPRRRRPNLPPQFLYPTQQPNPLSNLDNPQLPQLVLPQIQNHCSGDIIFPERGRMVSALVLREKGGDFGVVPCGEGGWVAH